MKRKGQKVQLPNNSIPITEVKFPEKLRSQKDEDYELVTQEEFKKAWQEKLPIILNVYGTGYVKHHLHPIVLTKNKDGTLSKERSMTNESYKEYKDFYVDRFYKGQVFKLKTTE